MLGVRLDTALEKKLTHFVKKTKQSKSQCAKDAIREYLIRHETDLWHDRDTLKAIQQMDNGEGIPLSDIYAYLDTWENEENNKA